MPQDCSDFNPRSPCGERPGTSAYMPQDCSDFNPRSPCGERPGCTRIRDSIRPTFQSTLPVWGATVGGVYGFQIPLISIHAPRVGSDLEESEDVLKEAGFQSTLPVWGATLRRSLSFRTRHYFNPRSPCGERLLGHELQDLCLAISIHAPRVGSDFGVGRGRW